MSGVNNLKQCPCGKVPRELNVTDAGHDGKWALVSGSCCGDWFTEFRTNYFGLQTKECMNLAIKAWDGAGRKSTV